MTTLARVGGFFVQRQRGLLVLLLAMLHFALLSSGGGSASIVWWLTDVGLFMLWQPFVHAERRLGLSALGSFLLILAVGAWAYGTWLLLFWTVFLVALVGGRVLFVEHRGTRLFYLLAFAYLLFAVLFYLVPAVLPQAGEEGAMLRRLFVWAGPLTLGAMLLMPLRSTAARVAAGPVDFVYSLFVFLLVAVLVLGSLSFMVIRRAGYIESLLGTLVMMAGMLLLLGRAWNPRGGFGGIGGFFSRYLLTVGLPFEEWLHRLTVAAEEAREPAPFLDRVLRQTLDLPWVIGGEWSAGKEQGRFGGEGGVVQEFSALTLRVRLYTHYRLSPTLIWHFRLLVQLVAEYHLAKLRERELEQMSYLQAVYETGARLTHDVKNLLQSLNNLCYVVQSLEGERAVEIQPLMQRQLPVIVQRLEQTLDKLRRPRGGGGMTISAEAWWAALQQRYASQGVVFSADSCLSDTLVPAALFDSVADNLLQNALEKRAGEPGIGVSVSLAESGEVLAVCDTGSPLPEKVAGALFTAPVASENGLGIGLYHAARQAADQGYALSLVENRPGSVRFELRRVARAA